MLSLRKMHPSYEAQAILQHGKLSEVSPPKCELTLLAMTAIFIL